MKFRLSDQELSKFRRRLKTLGLSQSEFLRNAVIREKVVVEENEYLEVSILDELSMIHSELGRQGGLLKMIIRPNQGQRELGAEEWNLLISTIKDFEKLKNLIKETVRKINGNS